MQKYLQYHWNIAGKYHWKISLENIILHHWKISFYISSHAVEELLCEEETPFLGCCQSRVGSVTKIFDGEGKMNEFVNVEIEFLIKHFIEENQVV